MQITASPWVETGDQTWRIRHRLVSKIGQEGRYIYDGNVAYVEIECKENGSSEWKKEINEGIAQSLVYQSGIYQELAMTKMTVSNLNVGNALLAKVIRELIAHGNTHLLVLGKEPSYSITSQSQSIASLTSSLNVAHVPYNQGPQGVQGPVGPSLFKVEVGQTWLDVVVPDFIASTDRWSIRILEISDEGPDMFLVEHEPDDGCPTRVRYVESESVIRTGKRLSFG